MPRGFSIKRLTDLPMLWSEQWRALGLQAPIHSCRPNPSDRRYCYPLAANRRAIGQRRQGVLAVVFGRPAAVAWVIDGRDDEASR